MEAIGAVASHAGISKLAIAGAHFKRVAELCGAKDEWLFFGQSKGGMTSRYEVSEKPIGGIVGRIDFDSEDENY